MTEATTPFTEDHDDDQEGEGPTEAVAEVLTLAAERLDLSGFIELALFSVSTVAAELSGEELGAQGAWEEVATVATLERLQIASEILAGVDLGDGPEEDEGEGDGLAKILAQAA
jgi:hypothetical protein